MARPAKEGLDYFSLDTDIANDDKMKLIKAKHGLVGFAIVVLLLTKIYHNGYFYQWSEDELYLFSDDARTDINTVSMVVNDCINKGLFSKKLYDKYGILTSHGVQKRFLQATTKRKKIILIREYFIADDYIQTIKLDNVTFTTVFSVNNPIADELMTEEIPQSKVKESKEKEKDKDLFVPTVVEDRASNKKYHFDQDHLALAERLKRRILENKADAKVPAALDQWADTIRLMMERDEREYGKIVAVIDWCQQDNFWRQNILSVSKLREKFDQLELKMLSCPAGTNNLTKRQLDDIKRRRLAEEYDRIKSGQLNHAVQG
jgi:hypothetical protein